MCQPDNTLGGPALPMVVLSTVADREQLNNGHATVLLEARRISRRFGATQALTDASIAVGSGEVVGLVGANGAGKSTLVKILSGAERADSGTVRIGSWEGMSLGPHQAQSLGVATIYQDPSIVPTLSMADNIVLGREHLRGGVFLSRGKDVESARVSLARVGLRDHRRRAGALSPAEQQLLEIAKALHRDARVIIMDEPTAALGPTESRKLFGVIDGLRADGVGILFISHRLDEVLEVCDRVTVMRDGRTVVSASANDLTEDDVVRAMIGHTIADAHIRSEEPGEILLEARSVSAGSRLKSISLELREGEVVGLTGLVGSGRSRLTRVLFGAERYDSGELLLYGRSFRPRSPSAAIRRGIGLVPEDRKRDALFSQMSSARNVTLIKVPRALAIFVNLRREMAAGANWLRRVQLRPAAPWLKPPLLSGGNQQKVVLARWLYAGCRVLILDEPGQGVDVGAKEEIFRLVREAAAERRAVLVVSQEVDELLQVADRVIVMRAGEIAGVLPREEVTEAAVLALSLGSSRVEP